MSDKGRLVAGRYRLTQRIGSGGMSTVWRAEDDVLGRQVALKRLHAPHHLSDDEVSTLYERARREARSAAPIEALLAREPGERPSAEETERRLRAVAAEEPAETRQDAPDAAASNPAASTPPPSGTGAAPGPTGGSRRKRRRVMGSATVAALATVAVAGALHLWPDGGGQHRRREGEGPRRHSPARAPWLPSGVPLLVGRREVDVVLLVALPSEAEVDGAERAHSAGERALPDRRRLSPEGGAVQAQSLVHVPYRPVFDTVKEGLRTH